MIISPDTKVGDLLEAIPEAEEALIEIAPKFKALKNPVLRRTVARVATLEQAARVADLPVNELVRALREALGQATGHAELAPSDAVGEATAPDWIASGAVHELDADALLAAGAVPIGKVSEVLSAMQSGEVLVIRSSFQVAPLLDAMRDKGHDVFSRRVGADAWEAWLRKG